jgi:hypothetical protein
MASSTAFQSVTPIIPRLAGIGYGAFPLDADQLIANQPVATYTVTVTVVDNTSRVVVTSDPVGISLDTDNEQTAFFTFTAGTILELTTDTITDFSGWSGDIEPNADMTNSATITVEVNSDLDIYLIYSNVIPE